MVYEFLPRPPLLLPPWFPPLLPPPELPLEDEEDELLLPKPPRLEPEDELPEEYLPDEELDDLPEDEPPLPDVYWLP